MSKHELHTTQEGLGYCIECGEPNTESDKSIDEILAWTDKCITSRVMREPTADESFIVDMRLRLTESFAKEIKDQLYSLLMDVIGEDEFFKQCNGCSCDALEIITAKLNKLFNKEETSK